MVIKYDGHCQSKYILLSGYRDPTHFPSCVTFAHFPAIFDGLVKSGISPPLGEGIDKPRAY